MTFLRPLGGALNHTPNINALGLLPEARAQRSSIPNPLPAQREKGKSELPQLEEGLISLWSCYLMFCPNYTLESVLAARGRKDLRAALRSSKLPVPREG